MGCGSSSENDRNATNLGDVNNYREEDAEAATAAFASRQGLGSRVTVNCWCKNLRCGMNKLVFLEALNAALNRSTAYQCLEIQLLHTVYASPVAVGR